MKFDEVQRDQDKKYEEMLSLLEVEGGAEKMGSYKAYTAAVQVALMEGVGD